MIADSPSLILATYFASKACSLGTTMKIGAGKWPMSISKMTDDMPNGALGQIGIYDLAPMKQGRYMHSGHNELKYGIKILIRSKDYPSGWSQGSAIMLALEPIGQQGHIPDISICDDAFYSFLNAMLVMGLTFIGEEKNRWQLFSINYRLTIK